MSIKKLVKSIKNYKSKKPVIINKYLDPSMFWVASNSAYVFAADKTLDLISQKVDSNEGLAMVGAYAALISGWGLVNKFVINPVTSKIKGFHNRRVQNETTVNGLSVIRSIGQIGSLVALYTLLNFNATINNFKGDVARVVNAFSREEQNPKIEEVVDRILPEYSVRKNGGPFSTGSLEGRTLGGLYSDYTGISGIVPKTVIIDFDAQLKNLWARKIKKSKNSVVKRTYEERVKKYFDSKPSTMSLDDYVQEVDGSIKEMKKGLNWNKVARIKGLNKSRTNLVKAITRSLNGRDLISYSLTEIMPSIHDGNLNKGILDFLLRNAGSEYVELLPAMYDKLTSFGPYQFTQYAVFDVKGKREGASKINQALPESKQIPGSVMLLEGDDHHKAAYLFAIDNIATVVKQLSRSQEKTLSKKWKKNMDDIVKYVATAHHQPKNARKAMKRWLDNGTRLDYKISCNSRLRKYAIKTANNRNAMYSSEPLKVIQRRKKINNQGQFKDIHKKNSKGLNVISYIVAKGDDTSKIAKKFNKWDMKNGDKFENVLYDDITNRYGKFIGSVIQPNQKVYVLAKRK